MSVSPSDFGTQAARLHRRFFLKILDMKKRTTLIDEQARKELDITRDEYALCSFVHYRAADPRQKKPGWCCDEREDIAEFVGITRAGLFKMITRMEGKNLIEVDTQTRAIRVTSAFVDAENKVQPRKQSLHGRVNKVDITNKVYKGDIKGEQGEIVSAAETSLQRLDRWISEISTGDEKRILLEAFQMVYKLPAARFDECLAAFRAKASTTAEKYLRRADVVEHFLNFSNSHCKKNPARAASAKYFSAENRAY